MYAMASICVKCTHCSRLRGCVGVLVLITFTTRNWTSFESYSSLLCNCLVICLHYSVVFVVLIQMTRSYVWFHTHTLSILYDYREVCLIKKKCKKTAHIAQITWAEFLRMPRPPCSLSYFVTTTAFFYQKLIICFRWCADADADHAAVTAAVTDDDTTNNVQINL